MAEIENKIKEKVKAFYLLIKDKYNVKGVFIYGSYAKGTVRKDSDIDVGVIVDAPTHDNRIEIGAGLFHEAGKVDTLIEPKCIFWDEYKKHDKASILAEIIRTGIKII